MTERIVLGSGKLYCTTAEKQDGEYVIPTDATLEQDENLLGYIQGGATVEYAPTFYTAEDDLGIVQKKFITEEEITLTSGVMTWNADVLKKLVATGRVTTEAGKDTFKVGGAANYDGTLYVLRFVHLDSIDGNIRVTIVGSNEAGFSMQFQKDKETVINAEFKAAPLDKDGTLLIVEFSEPDGSTDNSTPYSPVTGD